ncbi:MAG: hypothetical protein BGP13_09730 [Sphingobacteriales bacterium 40-81]|nr:MAG: hypothetical protein BGP13_09730 [Sphingobacteriales bacterium 40-81]
MISQPTKLQDDKSLITTFNIKYKEGFNKNDSLVMYIMPENGFMIRNPSLFEPVRQVAYPKDSIYTFTVQLKEPRYFILRKNGRGLSDSLSEHLLHKHFMEPGDSILMIYGDRKTEFSGRGSKKYFINEWISRIYDSIEFTFTPLPIKEQTLVKNTQKMIDLEEQKKNAAIQFLNKIAEKSATYYELTLADIYGTTQGASIYSVSLLIRNYNKEQKDSVKNILIASLKLPSSLSDSVLALSSPYMSFLGQYIQVTNNIYESKEHFVNTAIRRYKGVVREKLITKFLLSDYESLRNPDSFYYATTSYIRTEKYSKQLADFFSIRRVGSIAYDFSLLDLEGNQIKLSDFSGKVVLLDFWYEGCAPCVMLNKEVLKKVKEYFNKNTNIVFISINLGSGEQAWKKAVKSGLYTDLGAVNVYTGELGYNHPVVSEYAVSAAPTLFLIDKNGRLAVTETQQLLTIKGLVEKIKGLL